MNRDDLIDNSLCITIRYLSTQLSCTTLGTYNTVTCEKCLIAEFLLIYDHTICVFRLMKYRSPY